MRLAWPPGAQVQREGCIRIAYGRQLAGIGPKQQPRDAGGKDVVVFQGAVDRVRVARHTAGLAQRGQVVFARRMQVGAPHAAARRAAAFLELPEAARRAADLPPMHETVY